MKKIGYQGTQGSYSHQASLDLFPQAKHLGFVSFDALTDALRDGAIDMAVMPIANSTAGRVSGSHNLIYEKDLYITDEYFLAVRHCLIANKTTRKKDIKRVFSHPQALSQCSEFIHKNGLEQVVWSDTAESVKYLTEQNSKHGAAIASELAAQIYGCKILKRNIQNKKDNTTRFVVLSRSKKICVKRDGVITSIFYITKNIPAALYKSLGGFATEGINLITIESFVPMKRNGKARFYLEFEGNPKDEKVKRALAELEFYAEEMRVLGSYIERKHR